MRSQVATARPYNDSGHAETIYSSSIKKADVDGKQMPPLIS